MKEENIIIENERAYFIGGFLANEKIELTLGISDGNKKQKKDKLILFVELINDYAHKISSVKIMVTAYIQRHYHGEQEALRRRDKWIDENKKILESLAIPYEIIDWKDVIETNEYKQNLEKINEILKEDEGFIVKINNLTKAHKQKGSEEKAKEYLLEEAAFFVYNKIHVCYPADNLNLACTHIIENYNKNAVFHPYGFKPRNLKSKNKEQKNKEQKNKINISKNTLLSNQKYLFYSPNSEKPPTPEDVLLMTMYLSKVMSETGCFETTHDKVEYIKKVLLTNETFILFKNQKNGGTHN